MLTINRIIWILIASSFLLEAAAGFLAPVLAIFIIGSIAGGTIAVAGFAAAVYWTLKAILQIPVGYYLDKKAGETDDLVALVAGHLIFGISFFLYLWATTPADIYWIEALAALGGALAVPPWFGMFMRHVDKFKEDFEWSVHSSLSFGLGAGVAGAIGGILAQKFGFEAVFILAGVFSLLSALVTVPLYKYLKTK